MESQLNPQAQALLNAGANARLVPLWSLTVEAARQRLRNGFLSHGPGPDLFESVDVVIPGPGAGCPARLYRAASYGEPVVLFLHGGGGVVNSVETHDRLCRIISQAGQFSVLSLDYRLAPEHPYPAGLDDAFRAWVYCTQGADDLQVSSRSRAVMGDSSGGTLAFAVSAMCLDLGVSAPDVQCLLYPVADHYASGFASYVERGTGYSLDAASMEWFDEHYFPSEWSPNDGYLFPLRRASFKGLPRTILTTAEFDPLRDEGRELARRLAEAGVEVEYTHAEDQMHGYAMQTKTIEAAADLVQQSAMLLGDLLKDAMRD